MKKLLSILLSLSLLSAVLSVPVSAAEGYPHSEHNYQNNCNETWEYEYPGQAEGLFVTFSEDTYLDPGAIGWFLSGDVTEEALDAYLEQGYTGHEGDRLCLYDGDGELYGWFTGDQLAGKTVYLKGDRFSLQLLSDGEETGYGFSVTAVGTELPAGMALVSYHVDGRRDSMVLEAGEEIPLNEYYRLRQRGNEIIVGWRTEDGAAYYYDAKREPYDETPTLTGVVAGDRAAYDLYPILCPVSMTKDDVFSFTNGAMANAETGSYYQSREQTIQFFADELITFGLTPFMPAVTLLLAFYGLYWPTIEHVGSCTGIAITELLQYHGKIDLLSGQGVDTVAELEPDEELQSVVNFYALQALPAHMVCNMAVEPGTEEYSRQLKALYDTVAAGKPVYFEFYMGQQHPMKTIVESGPLAIGNVGHSIVLTGAYTDGDGNHVLVACDCNFLNYSGGTCDIVLINEDFTEIYKPWYQALDEPLRGFSWTADTDQFDSLKAEGVPNPFSWHVAFLRHFVAFFRNLLSLFMKKI